MLKGKVYGRLSATQSSKPLPLRLLGLALLVLLVLTILWLLVAVVVELERQVVAVAVQEVLELAQDYLLRLGLLTTLLLDLVGLEELQAAKILVQ